MAPAGHGVSHAAQRGGARRSMIRPAAERARIPLTMARAGARVAR
jgi:hypothetical protein